MSKKNILITMFLTSTILLSGCSTNNDKTEKNNNKETQNQEVKTKKEAYNFLVKDKDGKEVKLSDFKGKKVYINVWASWCGPCIHEIPELEKVYQEIKDREDIVFLSITSPRDSEFENNNPADETKQVILTKANELGVSYPILFDFQDKVFTNYSIRAFPTHILINSDGTINTKINGMINEKVLKSQIDKLK